MDAQNSSTSTPTQTANNATQNQPAPSDIYPLICHSAEELSTLYHKYVYCKHKETISKRRKNRYSTDPEYRKKLLAKRRAYYQKHKTCKIKD